MFHVKRGPTRASPAGRSADRTGGGSRGRGQLYGSRRRRSLNSRHHLRCGAGAGPIQPHGWSTRQSATAPGGRARAERCPCGRTQRRWRARERHSGPVRGVRRRSGWPGGGRPIPRHGSAHLRSGATERRGGHSASAGPAGLSPTAPSAASGWRQPRSVGSLPRRAGLSPAPCPAGVRPTSAAMFHVKRLLSVLRHRPEGHHGSERRTEVAALEVRARRDPRPANPSWSACEILPVPTWTGMFHVKHPTTARSTLSVKRPSPLRRDMRSTGPASQPLTHEDVDRP